MKLYRSVKNSKRNWYKGENFKMIEKNFSITQVANEALHLRLNALAFKQNKK